MITAMLILAFFVAKGLVEGMVMIQPQDSMADMGSSTHGVRSHRWFEFYHMFSLARDVALILVVAALFRHHPNPVVLLGTLTLGWQATESAYNFSRYHCPFTDHENLLGAIPVDGIRAWLTHILRIGIGMGLVIGGHFV